MKPLALALVLLSANTIAHPSPANARIIQTACDTLATDPPTVRFTFAFFNDCQGVQLKAIQFHKGPGCLQGNDSCCVLECAAPDHWLCEADPLHRGGASWSAMDQGCVFPGERVDGFSLVTHVHACCFSLYYNECGAPGDPWCDEQVCLSLDRAVGTRQLSWGELKAIYR